MIENKNAGIQLYEFDLLQTEKHLVHFVTTRHGGFSTGNYKSLNLSYRVNDSKSIVDRNRKKLIDALNITRDNIFFPDQCHTHFVREVNEHTSQHELKETDALITNSKNLCIAILTADCVPILLYDRKKRAIGAVHSGWKGTVGRIVARTIERMVKTYNTKPYDLLVCIGPSISQQYYEVGDEVVDQFTFWFADTPAVFMKNKETGKTHIDLWEANRQLLIRSGVLPANIEMGKMCTYDNPDLFFSARRDGIQSGRFFINELS